MSESIVSVRWPLKLASISRRKFLASSGLVAGTAGAVAVGAGRLLASPARPEVGPQNRHLVLITLYGGNDGLNTVVPTDQWGPYRSARGPMALKESSLLPITSGLALHPNLGGFRGLYEKGQLAVVLGVGYPDPSFSHFRSMDIWQSAVPEEEVNTGWLGRWLDATSGDPARAISIGPLVPEAMIGARFQAAAVPAGSLRFPGSAALASAYTTMSKPTGAVPPLVAMAATSGSDMLDVRARLADILGSFAASPSAGRSSRPASNPHGPAAGSAMGPGDPGYTGPLGEQLDAIARLIDGGFGARVYGASLGGFDTHADELDRQAKLLAEVDASVTSFVNHLAESHTPDAKGTVVAIYTEFGRRVAANASGGTDHGSANPVFICGPAVRGGVYGEYPSLTHLDDGNMIFNQDFRSIYATLLANVVGVDPKPFLNGRFPEISFL
jgi:uncharacterized protein (DUF1501 family)